MKPVNNLAPIKEEMDLGKLKKQKGAYRTHLNISVNKLTEELNKEEKDRDNEILTQYVQQIDVKYDKWEKAMMSIQDNDPDIDIEKSMDEIDETLNSVIQLKVKANNFNEKVKAKAAAEVKVEKMKKYEYEEDDDHPAPKPKIRDRMNLPKLPMKKFNGTDIERFQEWFQFFDASINSSTLSTVEKFMYLKMSLEENSEAAQLIDGYPITDLNYEKALTDLKEAYGDPDVVINYHVSKLLSLPTQSNPQSLKDLYHKINTHVRSLAALGIDAEQYSVFLVPIVMSKLSDSLRKDIIKSKIKDITDLLDELKEEVEVESSSQQVKDAFSLETKPEMKPQPRSSPRYLNYDSKPPINTAEVLTSTTTRTKYCIFCPGKQSHWVDECNKAKNLPPQQVKEIALKENACLGCFRKGHKYRDCRIRTKMKCAKCESSNHHTYLHEDTKKGAAYVTTAETENKVSEETVNQPSDGEVKVKGAMAVHCNASRLIQEGTIMPVVKVRIKGSNGKKLELNCLLDGCSDTTFIRSDVTRALELNGPTVPIIVKGIEGCTEGKKGRKMINTSVYNRDYNQQLNTTFVEIPVICEPFTRPAVPTEILNSRNLRNLNLADNYLNEEVKEIHALIGLDNYYTCVTGRVKREKGQPIAIETIFGWMLVADSKNQCIKQSPYSYSNTMFITTEVEKGVNYDLKKFWELDEEIVGKPEKPENEEAIRKFHETVSYDKETKKYEVGLPYIDSKEVYSNYKKAEIILKSQLKRFERNPTLKEKYHQAMNEYIDQGFAERVPEDEIYSKDPSTYYIPHSAVIKDDNTSTKVRIVCNASSSAKNQKSLNDLLLKGPKRQPSITEILIRWRYKDVALVSDIRKMYSMILVRAEDRNALRFLWVDEKGNIIHYRHKVLPFGVRSAPYLAIETVQSHILKYSEDYPDVTDSLVESMYVDDYCPSEDTVEAAIDAITASNHIVLEAGMELKKWKSNNPDVMKHINEIDPSTPEGDERKVLGTWWNAASDEFYYKVNQKMYKPNQHITKRMIIGSVPTLHDPIGFIAPVILKAKVMIQKLWASGVEWDEDLTNTDVANEWLTWKEDLNNLSEIKQPRKYSPEGTTIINQQVHVFCDASEKGYAAAAYMRSEDENSNIHVSLITAKTKVAPLKFVTLPRLELLSAVIGSRLSLKIKTALKNKDIVFYHWSDSSITLHWIKNSDTRWKTFVETRVDEIRNTDPASWSHCPGKENPADVASRGTCVSQLQESPLWWGGPDWLRQSEENWPKKISVTIPNKEVLREKRHKQVNCLVTTTTEVVIDPHKYNKMRKLIRVTAYLKRFINNCKSKKAGKPVNLDELTAEELQVAETYWLKQVQEEYYHEELTRLKSGNMVKKDSKISQLSPILDEETGLMKMKGRIQNSNLTEEEKHPVILPHQSHIVRLLVEDTHRKQMHSGINHTLVALREKYWVTHARNLVKSVVKSCLICSMYMPKRLTAPLPPLPEDRVTENTPFSIVGVDFTGPVYISETRTTLKHTKKRPVKLVKTKTTSKAYISLTTCAVTRSVHLELVPDLTTDAFIRSFRRFVSRRGLPSVIYSDNAKTYKCAEKNIIQCYEILNSPPFKAYLAESSIEWKYICPLSPWWGGFWERLMKTIKIPMKKILGKSFLSSDEFTTVLTEVEAMVNSRPIVPVNDDPDSLDYLTPANFLIGRSTINLPVRPLTHTEVNPNVTRRQLNLMLQYQDRKLTKIWKMWKEEYLRHLGTGVGVKEKLPISEGDLVMVASGQQPRCTWKVGRVEELLPGRDDRIRSAIIRSAGKSITRPIKLISKLEV